MDPANGINGPDPNPTVQDLIDEFEAHGLDALSPLTQEQYRRTVKQFAKVFGKSRAMDLKPIDYVRWQKTYSWGSWSKRRQLWIIRRLFNWSVAMGLLPHNPFRLLTLPAEHGDSIPPVTDEQFKTMVRASPPHLRRLLYLLRWTGARPCEWIAARWQQVEWEYNRIVLKHHKTFRQTRRPRRIYLPPVAVRLLRWMDRNRPDRMLVRAYEILKAGPVPAADVRRRLRPFRPTIKQLRWVRAELQVYYWRQNGQWTWRLPKDAKRVEPDDSRPVLLGYYGEQLTPGAWKSHMRRLKRRTGLKAKLYGTRSRFAHDCMKKKIPLKTTSLLLGHSTTAMVEKHYLSAIGDDIEMLSEAAAQAVAKPGAPPEAGEESPSIAGELLKLKSLHEAGDISDQEYAAAKAALLSPKKKGGAA